MKFCKWMRWVGAVTCTLAASQSLLDMAPERIARVVQTNLLGSLLCTRAAARAMAAAGGGHIFNMDGAGADGQATPQYAAYGATKAGTRELVPLLATNAVLTDMLCPVGT